MVKNTFFMTGLLLTLIVFSVANAEIPASLEISGPDTIVQLEVGYFGVTIGGDTNLNIYEWSCEPESAGFFTSPQQAGTGFVTEALNLVSSLEVVISVRITTGDGDELLLLKNLTIESGLSAESWSVSLDDNDIYISDIAIDDFDHIYIVGSFSNPLDFDPGPGEDLRVPRGCDGDFLSSYDASGNYRWTVTIEQGDEGQEWIHSVVVTSSGEIVVMGEVGSELHLDRGDRSWDFMSNETYDTGYALRFNQDGEFLDFIRFWEYSDTVRGGISNVDNLIEDPAGNMYISGTYSGRLDFDLGPGQDIPTFESGFFVTRMDSNFNSVWVKISGSEDNFYGRINDLSVMPDGSLLMAGNHTNPISFTSLRLNSSDFYASTDESGSFICVIDSDGNIVKNRLWNSGVNDYGFIQANMITDTDGSIFVLGKTNSEFDLDPGDGEYFIDTEEYSTPFFVKWSNDLDLVDTFESFPPVSDFKIGEGGEYYAAGVINGTFDLDPGPGVTEVTVSRSTAYVVRIDRDYNLLNHWLVPFEYGSDPVIDVSGNGSVVLAMGRNVPMVVYIGP